MLKDSIETADIEGYVIETYHHVTITKVHPTQQGCADNTIGQATQLIEQMLSHRMDNLDIFKEAQLKTEAIETQMTKDSE